MRRISDDHEQTLSDNVFGSSIRQNQNYTDGLIRYRVGINESSYLAESSGVRRSLLQGQSADCFVLSSTERIYSEFFVLRDSYS